MNEPRNPWKTLSSRAMYSNPWFSVREDQVIRPDGQPGIYGVIETRLATGVVALTPAREVYLVGQYRYPTKLYSWEIIEGGTEDGEGPLAAAQRELREEAGLLADRWNPLAEKLQLTNCISAELGYLYLAEGLTEVPAEPDGTEELAIRRVPLDDALRMVESGEISDGMSVMGLLLLARSLGQ